MLIVTTVSEEQPTFEQTRDACAIHARTKIFAELTVRHKVSLEIATKVSQELYYELKSLRVDQVEPQKTNRKSFIWREKES